MPRVTRRSIATKEDAAPEERPASTSRGKRSTSKKEEPKKEDVAIGEPVDGTPKRGGRQPAQAKEVPKTPPSKAKAAPKGNAKSRRGRKGAAEEVEEDESKEEETVEETEENKEEDSATGMQEVEEEKPRGRSGRKGKPAEEPMPTTDRSSSRGSKGRGAAKEVEPDSVSEEKPEETYVAVKGGRGSRSRGRDTKPEPATPSPRASGRSSRRGRSEPEEKPDEEAESESVDEKVVVEEKSPVAEKTPVKVTPTKSKTPSPASKKATKSPQPGKPDEEAASESVDDKAVVEEKSPVTEKTPVKVTSTKSKTPSPASKKTTKSPQLEPKEEEPTQVEEPVSETMQDDKVESMETEESPQKSEPKDISKKRKLENEEDEVSSKRAKPNESTKDESEELSDFIVVNKEDVPAADSKEVLDSAPKVPPPAQEPDVTEANNDAMETDQDSASDIPTLTSEQMKEPMVVPLTEAELAKQYSRSHIDKDETSSTLVEVGSEGPADITATSVRNLDTSDAFSMDSSSTFADDTSNYSTSVPPPPQVTTPTRDNVAQVTTSLETTDMQVTPPAPAVVEVPASADEQKSSESVSPTKDITSVPEPTTNNTSAVPINNTSAAPAPMANEENHGNDTPTAIVDPPSKPPQTEVPVNSVQAESNGHVDSSQNSVPEINSTPSPAKLGVDVTYKPSSTAIDSRKFILNKAFPLELMDPAFCFSVVSYNILAECHWRRSDYSYTAPEHMALSYRHELMMKELKYLDGDIVCLQEVEPNYYKDTLLPAMTALGYVGWFTKRTKDYWDEGEATFVRTSKFAVKSTDGVSLKELAFKEVDESGLSSEVSAAIKQYLDRSDILLLTQLECLKTGKQLTIGNIHVVYDPPAPDVQCIQVACSIKHLVSKAGSDLCPHIICGDFNSPTTGAAYQLAKDGYLTDDHIVKLQAIQALQNTDGSSRSLIHHMWRAFQHTSSNLKSAYEITTGQEPMTCFTQAEGDCGALDYIFYSVQSLNIVGVTEILDKPVATKTGGMPSVSIPSDHLSLKAVFRIK